MADQKPPAAGKDALSRALGAAFLSHQVAQLERTVGTHPMQNNRKPNGGSRGRGGARARGGRITDHSPEDPRSDPEDAACERKDADVIVVDTSALVHAIGQIRHWCHPRRTEVIVVPLEALNTLDLLKKGTTPLAQRARAASRILEQQVGTNPRIRVQRDDAFVPWEDIIFTPGSPTILTAPSFVPSLADDGPAPEWLRRTICCARWEHTHAIPGARVALAVALPPADSIPQNAPAPALSTSPVPLPAPYTNKHELRASGALVTRWGRRSGLTVLDVQPTTAPVPPSGSPGRALSAPRGGQGRASSDEEWRSSGPIMIGSGQGKGGTLGRKGGAKFTDTRGGGGRGDKLVERPAATMAMNASVLLPNKVVRVLARGEKLDP